VDETYIKVKAKWAYLYRALDRDGNTVAFYLSSTRSINAAKRFPRRALRPIPEYAHPNTTSISRNPTYAKVIAKLQAEGACSLVLEHKYRLSI
jgi:transposase-like protein